MRFIAKALDFLKEAFIWTVGLGGLIWLLLALGSEWGAS